MWAKPSGGIVLLYTATQGRNGNGKNLNLLLALSFQGRDLVESKVVFERRQKIPVTASDAERKSTEQSYKIKITNKELGPRTDSFHDGRIGLRVFTSLAGLQTKFGCER